MTAKLCHACYADLFDGNPIRRVTLGRQCAHCKKATDRGEMMIAIEPEALTAALTAKPTSNVLPTPMAETLESQGLQ
jgi:hypothetical protein